MIRPRFTYFSLLLLIFAIPAVAQSNDDLPAAPSEVKKPQPPPPTAPKESKPQSEATASGAAASDAEKERQNGAAAKASVPGNLSEPADTQESERRPDETIRVPVNEVNVVFTVTDKHNHYIKDLKKTDFKVIDDERPVQEIRSFRSESNLPLQVGLLVDASNSIRDRFKFEQESAIEFLNDTIRPRYDQGFIVGFDVVPELTQDLTDSTEKLSQGIRALRPGNATAMYDALFYACRDKLLKSAQVGSARRAIILLSDGDDNASHVTREEAIEMALRANVIVYTISTNFPSGGSGDKVLQRIAEATGGRAFQPFQLSDVANAFAQIQDDLRSQYELSYHPDNFTHDGRYRTIEISALRKGLKVRSRTGYYAPGQ
jgi:VWFA-related protein